MLNPSNFVYVPYEQVAANEGDAKYLNFNYQSMPDYHNVRILKNEFRRSDGQRIKLYEEDPLEGGTHQETSVQGQKYNNEGYALSYATGSTTEIVDERDSRYDPNNPVLTWYLTERSLVGENGEEYYARNMDRVVPMWTYRLVKLDPNAENINEATQSAMWDADNTSPVGETDFTLRINNPNITQGPVTRYNQVVADTKTSKSTVDGSSVTRKHITWSMQGKNGSGRLDPGTAIVVELLVLVRSDMTTEKEDNLKAHGYGGKDSVYVSKLATNINTAKGELSGNYIDTTIDVNQNTHLNERLIFQRAN